MMKLKHTLRSSRFPDGGVEDLDSEPFDSGFADGGDSFFGGSGFFSGGGLDFEVGLLSSFVSDFEGSGSDDVDCSLDAGSFGSLLASFAPPSGGAPPVSNFTKS
jgi:hypothetical protein